MTTLRNPTSVKATWMFCLIITLAAPAFAQTIISRIPTLGGSAVDVRAMNNLGVLAGFSRTPVEDQHAFVFSGGLMQDLQTLGGPFSLATGLNDAGHVIGDSDTADGSYRAFLFRDGTMNNLGTLPGGSLSSAVAINSAGHILGQGDTTDGYRAFLFRDGMMNDLGSLGSGFSSAFGLNGNGDVVGDSSTDMMETHAFLYRSGVGMTDLGTLGGSFSRAWAINDAGVVAGEARDLNGELRAFRYDGTMVNLGTLGGAESMAFAINRKGDILGDSLITGDQYYRSFIVRDGVMMDLGTLGGNWNTAYAMNNLGHVVGESETATGTTLPFIWRDGVMTDLNTLLPEDSGWVLASAYHINDRDQVVGFGFYNGEFAWYLMSCGSANQPPVANAGSDLTVECGAMTLLDGGASTDPENDPLTFEWREGTTVLGYGSTLSLNLGLGTHTITLTVRDSNEASSDDTLMVVVRDTTAPSLACEQSRTVPVGSDCQAAVPDFAATAIALDGCSAVEKSQTPAAGTPVGLGTHSVVVTATDAFGNAATCTVALTVADMTAPTGECAPAMTVAATGANCTTPMPDFTPALLATDNCTPAAQLIKSQAPTAGTLMAPGTHNVTLTVADAAGNKSVCVTTLTVTGGRTVNCPEPLSDEANGKGLASVPNFKGDTTVSGCGWSGRLTKTQVPAAGTKVGIGVHTVTVTVRDAAGNQASCETTFTVVDRKAPKISNLGVNPETIRGADGRMVPVTVSVTATDNSGATPTCRILSISSSDPVSGGSDTTSPDWVMGEGLNAQLRAENSGRSYTITVIATDAAGNSSTDTVRVRVRR